MKKLICKIFGHKKVDCCGYIRCMRCMTTFIEVDTGDFKRWIMSKGDAS